MTDDTTFVNEETNEDIPIIKHWKSFKLDSEYRGQWIVAGDVDGDGEVEIVSARNAGSLPAAERNKYGNYITSVIAHHLDGSVLWKWGNPRIGRNYVGYDIACQIYDWDGDGNNEVIIASKDALITLDGKTGKEKRRFSIPAGATDCIVFCNLTGNERATDVLVKNRYDQIWAFNYEWKLLWTSKHPGGYLTAHQPRPIDIDGDGKDEIMAGYAMLNPDGKIRWVLKRDGGGRFGGHLDCARVYRTGRTPEDFRIVLTFCGGKRIAMIDGNGEIIWALEGEHYQSVDVGKVCTDVPGDQVVVDCADTPFIRILDENGTIVNEIVVSGNRFHRLVDWTGDGIQSIVVGGQERAMFNCRGKKIGIFDIPVPDLEMPDSEKSNEGHIEFIPTLAEMTGNGIPDLIFSTSPGSVVYVYKNENGSKPKGGFQLGTGVNYTLY